jgi:hypothetical protein
VDIWPKSTKSIDPRQLAQRVKTPAKHTKHSLKPVPESLTTCSSRHCESISTQSLHPTNKNLNHQPVSDFHLVFNKLPDLFTTYSQAIVQRCFRLRRDRGA